MPGLPPLGDFDGRVGARHLNQTVPAGLADLMRRRWLLVGVGNELRGDDAFGPLLARALAEKGLPALDGGRLIFLGYEAVTRRRANEQFEMAVHAFGIVFLLGVMILVTYRDIFG